ncbi:hypothetical protein FQR65_LT19047 [Abscondita terminalis]|nr:hypothetical protein FQR65_LT19047 [Abscondita terminalis]
MYLLTVPPILVATPIQHQICDEFNTYLRGLNKRRITVIDLHRKLDGSFMERDGIHLNNRGIDMLKN